MYKWITILLIFISCETRYNCKTECITPTGDTIEVWEEKSEYEAQLHYKHCSVDTTYVCRCYCVEL